MTRTIHITLKTRTYDDKFDRAELEKQIFESADRMEDHLNRLTDNDVDILIEGDFPNE